MIVAERRGVTFAYDSHRRGLQPIAAWDEAATTALYDVIHALGITPKTGAGGMVDTYLALMRREGSAMLARFERLLTRDGTHKEEK